jgi:Arc/MetJ-type ribon-helix-helix transcriptional regulator
MPPKDPPKDRNLNVRVSEELLAAMEALRDRAGPDVTVADVVRRALREYVARELPEGEGTR